MGKIYIGIEMADKELITQLKYKIKSLEQTLEGANLIIELETATSKGAEAEIRLLYELLQSHNITVPTFYRLGKRNNDR